MAVGKKSIQRVSRMATETEEMATDQAAKDQTATDKEVADKTAIKKADIETEKSDITDSIHEEKFKMIHSIKSELPPYLL